VMATREHRLLEATAYPQDDPTEAWFHSESVGDGGGSWAIRTVATGRSFAEWRDAFLAAALSPQYPPQGGDGMTIVGRTHGIACTVQAVEGDGELLLLREDTAVRAGGTGADTPEWRFEGDVDGHTHEAVWDRDSRCWRLTTTAEALVAGRFRRFHGDIM